MGLLLVVVVVLGPLLCERELLFGHRRGADFVLEEGEQVAHDAVIQLERALVLRDARRLGIEAGDDVVAVFLGADGVRELTAAPVVHLHGPGSSEELVESIDLFGHGGVFERGVEDVDRLVWTWHVLAILPLDVSAPRWLPERGEGKWSAFGQRPMQRVVGTLKDNRAGRRREERRYERAVGQ